MKNLWENTSKEKELFPETPESQTADLLIIGGGFTGCSAALEAARQGAKVVLIECEKIQIGGNETYQVVCRKHFRSLTKLI